MEFIKTQLKWFVLSFLLICAIVLKSNAQCPIPVTCTYTAVSGTNYTVNTGETLCIKSPTNYSSGTITLNGGTLYVENGATLSRIQIRINVKFHTTYNFL